MKEKAEEQNGEIYNLAHYQGYYVNGAATSKSLGRTVAYRQIQEDVFAAQRALAQQMLEQSISLKNANVETQKLVRKKD